MNRFRAICDWTGFAILIGVIATAVIPYGAITPDAILRLQAGAFAVAFFALLSRQPLQLGAGWITIAGLSLIAALGLVQLLPLPPEQLQTLSPVSAKVYDKAASTLVLYGQPKLAARISIAPTDTEKTLLLTVSYAALFFGGAVLGGTQKRRRAVSFALLASSVLHIAIAASTQAAEERVHGTFVNANHFAGFLHIALAAAFALLWTEILKSRDRAAGIHDNIERLQRRIFPLAVRIILWAVIAIGIATTRSRGGILAAAITTIVVVFIGATQLARRKQRRIALLAGVSFVAALIFVAATTGKYPLLRFAATDPRDPSADLRPRLWSVSLEAWREFPIFGSGLGSFREAFRRVQPADLEGLVEQAHNDSLQLLVTGGVIGLAAAAIAMIGLGAALLIAFARERHREERALLLGGFAALLALTLHGLVEFNFSLPAIPATLSAFVGTAWAARSRSGVERSPTLE